MGIFGRSAPGKTRSAPVVLRAAGARIDLRDRESIKHLVGTKQAWQTDAWVYRDLVPELRFAGKFVANAIGRVRFIGAVVNEDGDDPIPFWKKPEDVSPDLMQAVEDELARLPFHSGSKFQGKAAENFDVAGECWLHGYLDPMDRERWEVLSVDEVQVAPDGVITLKNGKGQIRHQVDPDTEEMLRLWVQHPRFSDYADSPLRALQDVLAEIVLNGRERRAVSRSRAGANGILLVPEGMSISNATTDNPGNADDDSFMSDLTAAMLAPINNEGEPGAVVPIVIQGNTEDLAGIRQVRVEREDSKTILDKLDNAVGRLGIGLDVPREILSGVGDSNHWSAWQIDASTYRYHIDPRCRILADSFTEAFLWPALIARGQFEISEITKVCVWFDASGLTENPNRTADAKDAYDRSAIGAKTLRDALGFTDEDAPDDDEILRHLIMARGPDPQTAALLMQRLFDPSRPLVFRTTETIEDKSAGQIVDDTAIENAKAGQPTAAGPGQAPTNPVPATGQTAANPTAPAIAASAAPEWTVSLEASRRLVEIERSLRDRLIVAADAAMARALERAGARVRSKANGKVSIRAMLDGHDVEQFAAVLGEQHLNELGLTLDVLLAEAFLALRPKFVQWTQQAVMQSVKTVLALLRLRPGHEAKALADRIEQEMTGRIYTAWNRLHDSLRKLAAQRLYAPQGSQTKGEDNGTLVPTALIRQALADVGGAPAGSSTGAVPVGGIATGGIVQTAVREAGGAHLGYEWVYGVTTPDREFHPHARLNGLRFADWHDAALSTALDPEGAWVGPYFHPGDHDGCLCDYVPVWAIPEYKERAQALLTDSASMGGQRWLAEQDTAAGRSGTVAQALVAERERIAALQLGFINRNP